MKNDCSVSIKIDKITKVINKIDYFMFRAMEKNNVDFFKMVEIIKNPKKNKEDLDKLLNTSRQLIDEQVIKYNKQAISATKKGDTDLADTYSTFSANLQNITANWKQATTNFLQYSDSFKVRTKFKLDQEGMVDLSEVADDEDAMYKKFVVDQSANEIDPFDNIDKATELFLRSIPRKGQEFDEYGFNLNVNYGSFVNTLLADLENTTDIDEIIEKLGREENLKKVPEYQTIIDRLKNEKNFLDTQTNINFRNSFAKAQIPIYTTSAEDNIIKVFEATKARRSMYQSQVESNFYLRGMPVMVNGVEVNLAHKDGQAWVLDSSDVEKIKNIFDKSVLEKVSAEESANRRVGLLKAVGFDFSPQTEKILKTSVNKVQFEYIYNHLINRLTVPSTNKSHGPVGKTDVITNPINALKKDWNTPRSGQNNVLNSIIELEIKYNPVYSIQRSIINNEGNQQFSTQNHNNFTVVNKYLSDFEKYKTLQDIIADQPSMEWLDAKTNPSIRSDLFMNSLFDFDIKSDTYGERRRVKYKNGKYEYTTNPNEGVVVQVKVSNTGGVQSKDEGSFKVDGASTTGLEEVDKLLQDINTFKLAGFSSVPRLSDKSTDLALNLNFYIDPITKEPKQRPLESVGSYSSIFTSEVFLTSMLNGVKDIARMKYLGFRGYYDDLDFSSKSMKNTWGMFDSIIPKEIKELLDTIITSESITTEEMAANLIEDPDTALLLKNSITDYFKKYSKEFLGKLAPVRNIVQKSDYLIGKGNDKFAPDFEGTVNYYLASKFLIDMSSVKIFFGDTIYFKDFTKRASKDSATGIFTFVENRLIDRLNDKTNPQGVGFNTNLSARMFADRLFQQGKISLEQKNEMLSKQEVSKEFKSAVFKDVEFNSLQVGKIINNVKALYEAKEISQESYNLFISDIKEVIEKKYNGEEGDGQGKCTFDFYRTISILTNNWTREQELSYKKIIDYTHYDELAAEEKDENKRAEYISKRDAVGYNPAEQVHFPPKKFQYAGPMKHDTMLKTNGNMYNALVPMFDKFSLYPLIPTVIKGTTDEELSKRMEFEGLSYIKFKSASKAERPKNMDDYYEGHDKNNPDQRTTIPFEKRLKTNTTKFNSEHTIFFNHLKEQVRIDSETHDHVIFGSQARKLILMNLLSSKTEHGFAEFTNLLNRYKTSMDALIKIEKTILYNKLGISNKNGVVSIDDMDKLVKYFRDEIDKKNQDSNVRKALNFDEKTGKFEIPLDASVQAQILEGIILASINNNIVRYKASGSMLTQVAVTGTEPISYSKEDSARAFNKYGNQGLKYYDVIEKNGRKVVTEMQVKVGFTKQWLPLLKLMHTDNTPIGSLERLNECLKDEVWVEQNKKSIRMISYRIPTQGRNFLDVMTVAEFLPAHFGDAIIMPTEIVVKNGGDFDIDKMFCFYPNLNENGTHASSEYTEKDLENPKTVEKLKAGIQNDIFQTMAEVILHPNNYMELVTPSYNYHLMPLVNKIYVKLGKLGTDGKRKTTDYKNTDVLNQNRNIEKFLSLIKGKSDLGIAAIANTFNVLFQLSNAQANPEFFKKKGIRTFFQNKYMTKDATSNIIESLSYDDIYDEDGILKSEFFSEFINAFVDVAKDDYVFAVNVVTEFSPMLFYMKNAGFSTKKILAFINQPILRSYIKNLSKYQNIFVSNFLDSQVDETEKMLSKFTKEELLQAVEDPDNANPDILKYQQTLWKLKAGARNKALSETLKEYGFVDVFANRDNIKAELKEKGDINYTDKFTSQGLYNNIQKEEGFKASNLTSEQKDMQLAVLYEMLNMKEQSDSLTNAQRFLNFDTNPYASSFDVYARNINYTRAISNEKKYIGNNVLSPETLTRIKKQSIISGLDVSEEIKTLLESLLPVRNNQELNERILGKVINLKENNKNKTIKSDDDMLRYARTYKNDLMTYVLQNYIENSKEGMEFFKSQFNTDKPFNEYLKELIDTPKMTDALNAIRNAPYYADLLESFPILGRVTIQPGQNTKNLVTYKFVESSSNPLEKQSIITQFDDIIQKKDAEIAPVVAFFKDLALYSIFQSGYNTSDNSYTGLTPISLINQLYSYGINEFSKVYDKIKVYEDFEKLFGKNNPTFYNDRKATDTLTGESSKKGKWYAKNVGLSLKKKEVKTEAEKTMSTSNKLKMKSYNVDKFKNGTKVTTSRSYFVKDGVYELTNDEGNNLMVELKLYKKLSSTDLTTPEMQNAYAIAEGYKSWLDLEENIMEGRTQTLTQDFLSGNQSVYIYRVKPLQVKQPSAIVLTNQREYTPDKITKENMPANGIFVFGSNTEGRHGKGAALTAVKDFGAINNLPSGLQGKSFAVRTKMYQDGKLTEYTDLTETNKKEIEALTIKDLNALRLNAVANPTKKYYVTEIGTKLAGRTVADMKNLFERMNAKFGIPDNIILPKVFEVRDVVKQPTQITTNPLVAAGIKSTDMNGNAAKDIQMASESTQFIGFGTIMKEGNVSSTDKYAKAWGTRANTGNYTANDVVMISGSGNFGRGGVDKTEEAQAIRNTLNQKYKSLIEKAIAARASFRVGNQYSKGNLSDELVAKYLQQKGYKEEKLTGYSRWTAPSGIITPVVQNVVEGVKNIPNTGLTVDQANKFIDILQPQIGKQSYVENKATTANMMFSFGLRWAKNIPNVGEKSEQAKNLGQPRPNRKQIKSKEGMTYGYYLTDQNNNPLPSIKELQPIIDFVQSKLGIDMSNYDAMLGNIYDNNSFIHQHRDTTESVTAEGYPVIVVNLGANGHLEYDKDLKSTYASYKKSGELNLTNGGIYAFGVDGKNRFTFHHRIGSGLESANPLKPITLPNGQVLKDYRITLTFRRASDLTEGMPTKPNVKAEIVKENVIKPTNEVTSDDIINNFRNELVWNIETSNADLVNMHNQYNETKLESEQTTLDEFLNMMSCLGKLK